MCVNWRLRAPLFLMGKVVEALHFEIHSERLVWLHHSPPDIESSPEFLYLLMTLLA